MTLQWYPQHTGSRYDSVDALRGILSALVVLFHLVLHFDREYGFSVWTGPEWMEYFRYGPHVFYMISGFAILLTFDRYPNALTFLKARLIRLVPVFWVVLLIATAVRIGFGPFEEPVGLMDFVTNALFIQELTGHIHIDGAYWSLVTEMAFYGLITVFVGALNLRHKMTWLLTIWSGLSLTGLLIIGTTSGFSELMLKEVLISRYSMFFIVGILMYLSIKQGRLTWPQRMLMLYNILIIFLGYPMDIGLALVGTTAVLWLAITRRLDFLLAHRPLLWLGALSYPLYLIHQDLGVTLMYHMIDAGASDGLALACAIALSLVLAQLLYTLVEVPSRHFLYHRFMTPKSARSVEPEGYQYG